MSGSPGSGVSAMPRNQEEHPVATGATWARSVRRPLPPRGAYCDHRRMRDCCSGGSGHFVCPDCGLYWDDGEGHWL